MTPRLSFPDLVAAKGVKHVSLTNFTMWCERMSLGTITIGSQIFDETSPGAYRLRTLAFGAPDNSVVIRANVNPKANPSRFSISRVKQVDLVENGKTTRETMTVTTSFVMPQKGFTITDAEASDSDLATFITVENLNSIAQGRN